MDELEHRTGLPDALRVLARDYPRDRWESHRNFDGLTRFWLDRHLGFRRLLTLLQSEAQALQDPGRAPHPKRLAQLAGTLLNELHGHHQIEDHHYFPRLAAAEPRLERGFALLDSDHQALDAHIHELADRTNAVLASMSQGQPHRDAAGRLSAALDPFHTFLDRHLTDEEELVVPVILHFALRF